MDFPYFDFEKLGETDVREEILAPLVRFLGYRSGTEHDVIREQSLAYTKLQLGRQKESDPTIRGRADYVCVAGGLIRWTIEAKCPEESLDAKAEAQAWSYANHPEIRAVYFVLCNGRRFQVFQTNRGHGSRPFFECTYEELHDKLPVIQNILAPSSVLRDNPRTEVDTGIPISPGLRSSARITGGRVLFDRTSPPVPPLNGMLMSITEGRIDRQDEGRLRVHLVAMVPNQTMQTVNEKFGLNDMYLISESNVMSSDPQNPTVFFSQRAVRLPAGEPMLNMTDWKMVSLPFEMDVVVNTKAAGYIQGTDFVGRFTASFLYMNSISQVAEGEVVIQLA